MIIAHDLGTTGDKATLVSVDGQILATVTETYGVHFGTGGVAEQSPHDWWNAVARATRRLLESSATAPSDIEAVSFSGQMMGVVAVDRHDEPVRPAIIWADTRAQRQTAQLVERVGMERAYAITGHRLNPTYSLPKLMWMRDEEPDLFAQTTCVLQAKDYIVLRLTGVRVTDPSDASGTDAFDQATGTFSDEILAAADIDAGLWPEIAASTTVVGTVHARAAHETGLAEGTPVVLGGGDGPMAALGAGVIDADSGAYAYLGSSSWVSISTAQPMHDPAMRSMTFNHVVPGRFVPTATMQTGGAALQWITDLLVPDGSDRYERVLDGAAGALASAEGLYFLPHLLGERSPYWNPNARAAFVGLAMHHGPAHLARAVLEGVAFTLEAGLDAFRAQGATIAGIDAIGGAARSGALLGVFADVWGMPVTRRDIVDEAGAIGAAVVAGVGVGAIDDFTAVTRFSAQDERHDPRPEAAARYANDIDEFRRAYAALEPWFDAVAAARR